MKPNANIYLTIKFKAIIAVKIDNTKVTEIAKKLILFSSKISGEMKNTDNIIDIFYSDDKKTVSNNYVYSNNIKIQQTKY